MARADLAVALDLVELDERDRSQHVREIGLVAGNGDVVEGAVPPAHDAQIVERGLRCRRVGGDQPALARGDVLRRVEAEAGDVGDRAHLPAAVTRLGGMRGVFHDRHAECEQLVEIGRLAVEVDRHDRLRPLVHQLGHACRVDVERVGPDIGEHRGRAAVDDHVGRRRPGDRRRDHLVTRDRPRERPATRCSAAVHDETASTCLASRYSRMRASSSAARGPVVSQPERSVSATASISSSPIAGGWNDRKVSRLRC